jgi:SpoVK/Ycf46/Vps4 family AAA+-type ATPase
MLLAYKRGDSTSFEEAASGLIAEEKRKNHNVYARDLARIMEKPSAEANGARSMLVADATRNGDVPKDNERGAALLEILEPRRDIESLVLSRQTGQGLVHIVEENRRGDILRAHGLMPVGKILFCGPPGCGKTVAAEAVAYELSVPLVLVRFDAVVSSYLGETAANLRKVFDFARRRPLVMLFDEFDAIGKHRTAEEEHGELKRVVNSFLQMLDGHRGEALLIAATNHQGLLDAALWRRFDEIIFFDRPAVADIEELLVRNLRQIGLSPSISLRQLAKGLSGMSHADIEHLARDAVKQTILEDRSAIEKDILMEAVSRQRSRIDITVRSIAPTRKRDRSASKTARQQ